MRCRIDGKLKRKRVGHKSEAIRLFAVCKSEIFRVAKLPSNIQHRGVRLEVLGREAIEWYIEHGPKDGGAFASG